MLTAGYCQVYRLACPPKCRVPWCSSDETEWVEELVAPDEACGARWLGRRQGESVYRLADGRVVRPIEGPWKS